MPTRTTNDADGQWFESLDSTGKVLSRELRVPSAAYLASLSGPPPDPAPALAARAALKVKAQAGTLTAAEIQQALATLL